MQARRVPIEGAAGVGYVLRPGFDLPALMFTPAETEAIAVGMRMLRRTGDQGLQAAAETVLSKVMVALPDALRSYLGQPPLFVSAHGAPLPRVADLAAVREAIRNECKLRVAYQDEKGIHTERTIWPVAIAYYVEATLIGAWCELRDDFRHFRADRILRFAVLDERFPVSGRRLSAQWFERFVTRDAAHPV